MNTTLARPTEEMMERAAKILRGGGLVGFPTETVYGLGADALNEDAVRSIFEAKGRPGDNPLIVHVSSLEEVFPLIRGELSAAARALAGAYWPGPLTMILPRSNRVPDAVTAGMDTVGIRMPAHDTARELIRRAMRPIAAPSANRSGRPSPTTAQHVMEDMDGRIPLIIDGGPCQVGLESTVLDVTGEIPRILRPGGVTPDMIVRIVGSVEVDGAVLRPLSEGERPRSPGMKYRHYAPKGELVIVQGAEDDVARAICEMYDGCAGDAAILALPGHEKRYGDRRVRLLGKDGTVGDVAASLFSALRQMDEDGVGHIFSEAVEAEGLGLAVMNRLGRAAAFRIVNV